MRHPSHATVVAYLALFVALGGSSYAAITITGKSVKNNSLTGADLKNESVTGDDVKNLTGADFAGGRLPLDQAPGPKGDTGAPGPQGPAGPEGPRGPAGTPDTSNFFTKSESDGRFVRSGSGGPSTSTRVFAVKAQMPVPANLSSDGEHVQLISLPGLGSVECWQTGLGLVRFTPTLSSGASGTGTGNPSGGPITLGPGTAPTLVMTSLDTGEAATLVFGYAGSTAADRYCTAQVIVSGI